MHTNRLIAEKSPYLLQHAHNPVDWMPWGQEAFEKARQDGKPIFLSIGYSTCHWCHVMEHESFESEPIAALLNENFVPIKVDREERPDVDHIYMTFVQATTGSGGWPMSVFLTPDLKPFFGGTYFPPDNRYGRPGFRYILERLAEAWRTERSRIVESADDVLQRLREASSGEPAGIVVSNSALDSGFYTFRRIYDSAQGGFGGAPKFPRPSVHNFLLRYHAMHKNQEALDMVAATLKAMARGGMNDQLGGGFHRYSVDANWFVPHFEKMLYDQAQLAVSYLEAYQVTRDEHFAGIAREILAYVLRDMTGERGGFYSAEDADSVIDPADPTQKGEGAFYVWDYQELETLLGEEQARWFAYRYGVEGGGNVPPAQDPHNEFTGRNILFEAHTVAATAGRFEQPVEAMQSFFDQARRTLLEARSTRVRPHLDDKVLTSWNALMISAFALAAQVLGDAEYEKAARRAAQFVLDRLYRPAAGVLLRRYRDGEAAIEGFLDDYAFLLQALLDLYETTFEPTWLETALVLAAQMRSRFEDTENGGFFSTTDAQDLILRAKSDYDGAEPSGNSIAILSLLRLARLTGRQEFEESAHQALRAFAGHLGEIPQSLPQMLVAAYWTLVDAQELVIAGDRARKPTKALLAAVRSRFLPNKVIHLLDQETRPILTRMLPQVAEMREQHEAPALYVCKNYACQLPVTTPEDADRLLAG